MLEGSILMRIKSRSCAFFSLLLGLSQAQATEHPIRAAMPPLPQRSGAEVFNALRQQLGDTLCHLHPASIKWLNNYTRNPQQLAVQLKTILPLLDYVSAQTKEKKLPGEFALIPFIESEYDLTATAKGGPAGLWQMMPSTAKHYGIRFGNGYDGRFSAVDATEAALNYLQNLQREFKHWQTALMAYNTGDAQMRIRLKQQGLHVANPDNHLPHGLAPHTYAYAHKIDALVCLLNEPKRYGIHLPETATFTPLTVIDADSTHQNLEEIATSAQISLAQLLILNPSYRKGLKSNAPNRILVPIMMPVDDEH
jgi:membrane-bound lytic murein transglycosylase D